MRKTYHQPMALSAIECLKKRRLPKLRETFFIFFLTALILAPHSLRAEVPTLEDLVSRIQENYEKAGDLKAGFIQETTIKTLKKTEREEGVVYLKKPKKMLWDYTRPKAKKLVINPKKAWLYVPDDNIVYVQDAKKVLNSRLLIKFLTGVGRLKEDFQVRYTHPRETDERGNYLLELVPRQAGLGIDRLLLTIDRDDYRIVSCSLTDLYGNLTKIAFRDLKVNNNLPDSLFTFSPPPGANVQAVP
ncbi:MAG TPA: outer membrane lipoprotein carrier protein LolA [Syntrophales bacterium]|nr:outer membrane lipoprotein carrier protein LolA [Syntrophales bacterium]